MTTLSSTWSATPRWLWRHRLLTKYFRSEHHPFKTTLSKILKHLLFIDLVYYESESGGRYLLDSRDYLQDQMLRFGASEPQTLELVKRLLSKGSVFIDVGGHIGQYSIEAALSVGETGRVVTFEPNPKTFAYLKRNLALNGLATVTPILAAATAEPSIVPMMEPPQDNWGLSQEGKSESGAGDYCVAGVRIADALQHLKVTAIDVLKMDVEGHEIEALEGLFCSGSNFPGHILIEFVPESFKYGIDLPDYLRQHGYEILTILGGPYAGETQVPEANLWARCKRTLG
jgi:FkbM family methyltransferase